MQRYRKINQIKKNPAEARGLNAAWLIIPVYRREDGLVHFKDESHEGRHHVVSRIPGDK